MRFIAPQKNEPWEAGGPHRGELTTLRQTSWTAGVWTAPDSTTPHHQPRRLRRLVGAQSGQASSRASIFYTSRRLW